MAAPTTFFGGISQEPISIRGLQGWSPLFFQDASMMSAAFTADYRAVQALLPTSRHRALRVAPGRGLVAIHCFEYRDCQLGPYSEVSVAVAVHPPGLPLPTPLRLAQSSLSDAYHAFVVQLPVNQELAMWGGLDYFNVPKFMARVEYAEDAHTRVCRVDSADTGRCLLELVGPKLPTRSYPQDRRDRLRVMALNTYPVINGARHCARGDLNLIEYADAPLPGGVSLLLGNEPESRQLRRLRLGRTLMYQYAPRCQLILNMPDPLA